MPNKLVDTLKDIGLTENEAQIYYACLALGPATVLKISKSAQVKRTTVYSVVESLKQKGLMRIEIRGFKQLYVAEDPEKLEGILERRREEFKKNLPEFAALYNLKGGEGFIKYYEGLEAIKSLSEGLVRDIRPKENYMIISDQKKWYELDPKFFQEFTERRAKKDINVRLILQDSPVAREFKKFERNYHQKTRLLPKDVVLDIDIITTPQRVLFHQLIPPIMAIVVENKSLIRANQELFEIIWSSLHE